MANGSNSIPSGAHNGGPPNNRPKKTFQQEVNETINELHKLRDEIASGNLKLLEYSVKIDKVQMSIRSLSEAASKINKPGLNKLQQMTDSLSRLAGAISVMSKQNSLTKGGVISELDRVTGAIEKLNKVELKTSHIEEATVAFNNLSKALGKVNKRSNVSINVSGTNVAHNVSGASTGSAKSTGNKKSKNSENILRTDVSKQVEKYLALPPADRSTEEQFKIVSGWLKTARSNHTTKVDTVNAARERFIRAQDDLALTDINSDQYFIKKKQAKVEEEKYNLEELRLRTIEEEIKILERDNNDSNKAAWKIHELHVARNAEADRYRKTITEQFKDIGIQRNVAKAGRNAAKAEQKKAKAEQADVDNSIAKENSRIQKEQNKQWNKFNKEKEKYENNQRKAREKAAADERKAEEKDKNDQEKLFERIEKRKEANEKKQLDKRKEIDKKNSVLERAYAKYNSAEIGSKQEQIALRDVYRAEEVKKIAEQELNQLSELHEAIDKALSMEEIDEVVKRIDENGEKLRESIRKSYTELISNTFAEEARIKNNKANSKNKNHDSDINKINTELKRRNVALASKGTEITKLQARAAGLDTNSSGYAKIQRHIKEKELEQDIIKEEIKNLNEQKKIYRELNDEDRIRIRLRTEELKLVNTRTQLESQYADEITKWTKETEQRLKNEEEQKQRDRKARREETERKKKEDRERRGNTQYAYRESIESRIMAGKARDRADAERKLELTKKTRQASLVELAQSKSAFSTGTFENILNILGDDITKKLGLVDDNKKTLAELKYNEQRINKVHAEELAAIDQEEIKESQKIRSANISEEDKQKRLNRLTQKSAAKRAKIDADRNKALDLNTASMAKVSGKLAMAGIAVTAAIAATKLLIKAYKAATEQYKISANIAANSRSLGIIGNDLNGFEKITRNITNTSAKLDDTMRKLAEVFEFPIYVISSLGSALASFLKFIADNAGWVDNGLVNLLFGVGPNAVYSFFEGRYKNNNNDTNDTNDNNKEITDRLEESTKYLNDIANNVSKGIKINGEPINISFDEALDSLAKVSVEARTKGFSLASSNYMAGVANNYALEFMNKDNNLGYRQAMQMAQDTIINGSNASAQFGYLMDDEVLAGYMAKVHGRDIVNVEYTESMMAAYRVDLMKALSNEKDTESMIARANEYKQFGDILKSTSGQLFDFQEVQTFNAKDFTQAEIDKQGRIINGYEESSESIRNNNKEIDEANEKLRILTSKGYVGLAAAMDIVHGNIENIILVQDEYGNYLLVTQEYLDGLTESERENYLEIERGTEALAIYADMLDIDKDIMMELGREAGLTRSQLQDLHDDLTTLCNGNYNLTLNSNIAEVLAAAEDLANNDNGKGKGSRTYDVDPDNDKYNTAPAIDRLDTMTKSMQDFLTIADGRFSDGSTIEDVGLWDKAKALLGDPLAKYKVFMLEQFEDWQKANMKNGKFVGINNAKFFTDDMYTDDGNKLSGSGSTPYYPDVGYTNPYLKDIPSYTDVGYAKFFTDEGYTNSYLKGTPYYKDAGYTNSYLKDVDMSSIGSNVEVGKVVMEENRDIMKDIKTDVSSIKEDTKENKDKMTPINVEKIVVESDFVFTENKASVRRFAQIMDNELSTLHNERGVQ